jgi:hypothetical protein
MVRRGFFAILRIAQFGEFSPSLLVSLFCGDSLAQHRVAVKPGDRVTAKAQRNV